VFTHVIRTRRPFPASARGVHMCTRHSSVNNVEYRIAFCCLWFFITAFTVNCKNVLNVNSVCVNHVYHCTSITNLYAIRELCCNEILVSWFVVSILWDYDEFVKVLLSLWNQRYMSNTCWYILFNGNGKGWGCGEEIKKTVKPADR